MPPRLQNQVAVITGAGRGIGAACARLFASEGARVVLASRTRSEIDAVAASIGESALAVTADVSDEESVRALFEKTTTHFGPPTILINNAAIVNLDPVLELETGTFDELMAINVRGVFLCSRELFRSAAKHRQGGAIVNMSSLGGMRSTTKFKGLSAYVTSKFAVVGLTESFAVEGRELGVRVNCVAPGAVDTEMLKKAAPFLKTNTQPQDVARTILFLADPKESQAITGSVIEIFSNA